MSVERRGNRWRVRWRDDDGRQRSRAFVSKQEAEAFDDEQRRPRWRSDTYRAIHKWLCRNYPKTGRCGWCGRKRPTEYAFLAGGMNPTRDLGDYTEMCVPCHRRYDARLRRESGHSAGTVASPTGVNDRSLSSPNLA